MNDKLKELLRALTNPSEKVPEGFKSVAEWAEEFKRSTVHTSSVLRKAHRAGKAERKDLLVRSSTGSYRASFYKLP
jgi:hypothetical protein